MFSLSNVWRTIYRNKKRIERGPTWARAIPGGVPRSPLELRVHAFLMAHPTCLFDDLVAEIAEYLRRSKPPSVLALLDEGLWGGWVWPAFAREELFRLQGSLLSFDAPFGQERRPAAGCVEAA
jgi:hypothetical protein